MKRVKIYENGSSSNSESIQIGPNTTITDFYSEAAKLFPGKSFTRMFDSNGSDLTSLELISDDDTIFISSDNSNFIKPKDSSNWVKLNVGGQVFCTSRTTLMNSEPGSFFEKMFNPSSTMRPSEVHSDGSFLIDRDPKYFAPILNFMRTGNLILDGNTNPEGVLAEAEFFGIQRCIPLIRKLLKQSEDIPLKRSNVISALITTSNESVLRFQGVNLNGADLSYLDLRNINFKFAKLKNAKLSYSNLSNCNFERADLTGANLSHATLSGVRMTNATLESANCYNCNFQDPTGKGTYMEGVNLRKAVLEDSDLTGANLRVANLKYANLKCTVLRGASLAGADLEFADLSGSDLMEANLRGANLKDASLELMINPVHMAQAIR